jgi:uncharacterized protein (DUF58 family)
MLTRSGLGAAITAFVLAVCGWWWGYEELAVAAAGLGAVVVAALWSARVAHAADIVRRVNTPRVARGERIRLTYRVHNPGRRRSTAATIVDTCDEQVATADIPALDSNDRTEVRAEIPTRRRGTHALGPWHLERRDPFGLAVGRRSSADAGLVIVHPRVHRLTGPYGAMHIVEHEAVIRRLASDPLSGFVSLREYVQGDDPRMIHWPTTARMGTLMIREHVELRRPEFTVVLDTCDDVATPEDFEEMVDAVASVAVHAIRSGVDVTVKTTSREHPGWARPIDQETVVLDLLTPVTQAPLLATMSLAELFANGIDRGAVVMITGPSGPGALSIRHPEISIIRVGSGAVLAPSIALAVETAIEFAERWRPWH